jgi:hypothetical protein
VKWHGWLTLFLASASALPAYGDPAPPPAAAPAVVAIADAAADDPIVTRLRAELGAAGLGLVDVSALRKASGRMALARELSADAKLALRVTPTGAEVWRVDERSGELRLLQSINRDAAEDDDGAAFTVRLVEVVRAELKPTEAKVSRRRETPSEPPPPPPERRALTFDVAAGASLSPGGIAAAPTFVVGGSWLPIEHIGVAVLAVASPFDSRLSGPEGESAVWTGLAGAGLVAEPTKTTAALGARFELGLAAAWVHMDGEATPPYRSGSATLVAALPYLRPSLRWRALPALALRLDTIAGVALPQPAIVFAGREVALWGRPLVVASAGIELSP